MRRKTKMRAKKKEGAASPSPETRMREKGNKEGKMESRSSSGRLLPPQAARREQKERKNQSEKKAATIFSPRTTAEGEECNKVKEKKDSKKQREGRA